VITDNAKNYRISRDFAAAGAAIGARQKFIRPHCPWTNCEAARFNRPLGAEWAHSRVFASNDDRAALLPAWLNHYNLNRPHLGIGGRSPISRINNAAGQYTQSSDRRPAYSSGTASSVAKPAAPRNSQAT
jgi:transposase InsO family protein